MHRPWTADEKAAFEASADPLCRLVYELCKGTAQRIGDVLEGYKITDITSQGVVLNKLETP